MFNLNKTHFEDWHSHIVPDRQGPSNKRRHTTTALLTKTFCTLKYGRKNSTVKS